jgi:hypothetical protein
MNKSTSLLINLLVCAFGLAGIGQSPIGGSAYAAVREEAVTYRDGDNVMKGFIVYDDAKTAKRPGIVIVHDWWGITKHMHAEAREYAG